MRTMKTVITFSRLPALLALLLLSLATPALPLPPSTTIAGVGDLDGALNQTLGVQADWDACKCRVAPGVVKITEGQAIAVKVTDAAKLKTLGIGDAAEGDTVEITWQGGDQWKVKHTSSGREITWRWAIPEKKDKK